MNNKGIITIYVLVFGAIFLLILSGLSGFILMQWRQSVQKLAWSESLQIAEAGLNYYRWCLNNEVESQCLLEKEYQDSDGNALGRFSLGIDSTSSCGETISRKIISTGWTYKFPDVKRKISVLYAKESVARYSYLLNDNVWIGSDHETWGYYHSNGGIRMDGENQSLVTSAQEDWICTSSFGCNPCPTAYGCWTEGANCVCPGVFTTANGDEDLFSFPAPSFDFTGITIDLAQMKNTAQSSGIYLPPSNTIDAQADGYHLKFINNGNVEVWIITNLSRTWAYSLEDGWHYDYFTISNEYLYNTYTIPSSCSVIFVEDNLWPEGEIKGKVAVASANLINPTLDTDVVLSANIDYTVLDGSDVLTLIAERNVLIGPQSPNQLELRGIFIAQKGRFGRNHYDGNIKDKLEIFGSIVSNGRVGTKWTSGSSVISGYLKRETYTDSNLLYNSPIFTPFVSSQFKLIDWEEL